MVILLFLLTEVLSQNLVAISPEEEAIVIDEALDIDKVGTLDGPVGADIDDVRAIQVGGEHGVLGLIREVESQVEGVQGEGGEQIQVHNEELAAVHNWWPLKVGQVNAVDAMRWSMLHPVQIPAQREASGFVFFFLS